MQTERRKRPDLDRLIQSFTPCRVEVNTNDSRSTVDVTPTASRSLTHVFPCLLCAVSFLDGIYRNRVESKRKQWITGSSIIPVGLLGDSEPQRGKSWRYSLSTPINEMENISKLCVSKGESWLWAVPVFYPLTCLEMVKWKYCKYSFPEVYPRFWCYSHYSAVILKHCDFFQKSKRFLQRIFFFFFFSRGSMSYLGFVPPW